MPEVLFLATATNGQEGLPRPLSLYDSRPLPVPWNMGSEWGTLSSQRQVRGEKEGLCQVCGTYVEAGCVFVMLRDEQGRFQSTKAKYCKEDLRAIEPMRMEILDALPLHPRCAALSVAHCPWLKSRVKEGLVVERPYTG